MEAADVGVLPYHYTVSHRKPPLESSSPCKSPISNFYVLTITNMASVRNFEVTVNYAVNICTNRNYSQLIFIYCHLGRTETVASAELCNPTRPV